MKINEIRNITPKYFDILEEKISAKFLQSKKISVSFNKSESTESLWKKHNKAIIELKICDEEPEQSLIDLKIEIANRIFSHCHLCERKCLVDRNKNSGICNTMNARISSEFLHFGEESILVPSHTIFFSGCTFKCVFCQNWDISQKSNGFYFKTNEFLEIINKRYNEGARNINWVGGDPTSNLLYILKVLRKLDVNIPQIWNSNMYCSKQTMKLLNGLIDLYLTDFKYGNNNCASRLSIVDKYVETIKRNHKLAYNNGEMIVRHLVLPNHTKCCSEKILKWIKSEIPNVAVNIMDQYRPEYLAYKYQDISRRLSEYEYNHVRNYAEKIDIYIM